MLIDSHAHIDYEYEVSTEALIEEARLAGVTQIIAIAAALESLDKVAALADRFPNVYFTTGVHPHDVKDFNPEVLAKMRKFIAHPKCVAIGELGLDFFYEHSDRAIQFEALEIQLDFSIEAGKPIVVHTRDADEDTMRFLDEHANGWHKAHPGKIPGVIHCFSGTAKLAEFCLALGYTISFSGIITFKNAEALRAVARDIVPLDRLMVETDSPYLAPIPHRGKKNHPAHTRIVAEKLAELKSISLEKLAEHTTGNTRRLFGF